MRTIPASELIINDDGSIFHLHLLPEQLADTVILVGDPGRVALVAEFFDARECEVSNREFKTVTGTYKGKRMTVLSTGIGIGNIDISVTELDALANVDFATRQEKAQKRQLTLVRLGTSGAIQPDIKVGEFVFSRTSVGFDGLLNYYKGRNEVCDLEIEKAFMEHVGWNELLPKPYFIDADKTLFEHFSDVTREGITIAAPGFYAPQGRWVRLEPQDARLNEKIESFDYHGRRITNFEMEGSALAGLAALMGHRAATICTIIAQRIAQNVDTDYKPFVRKMISTALDKLAVFFLFKRRLLQIRLCVVEIVLLIGSAVMEAAYYFLSWRVFSELSFHTQGFRPAIALPLVCLLFAYLAARAVFRDELMVRAADRIR